MIALYCNSLLPDIVENKENKSTFPPSSVLSMYKDTIYVKNLGI